MAAISLCTRFRCSFIIVFLKIHAIIPYLLILSSKKRRSRVYSLKEMICFLCIRPDKRLIEN